MSKSLSLLILLSVFAWLWAAKDDSPSSIGKPELPASQQTQAKQIRETLTAWQAEDPVPSNRKLRVVYWSPSDREPAAAYRERLTRIMLHIQEFYRSEMARLGFGPLTFPMEWEEDDLLKIHVVAGQKPTSAYRNESGREIRKECLPTLRAAGLNPDRETLLIFCNLAHWDEEKKTFSHHSPYYAGGNHRSGNAWQLDSPELDIPNLALTEPIIQDGQYGRISLGKHNSIFIGGIAHELGHALSLPHNREAPALRRAGYRALMGNGNQTYGDELRGEGKGSHLQFAGALRLASQPLFSRSAKGLRLHARAELEDLTIKKDAQSFTLSGRVTGNVPVYGLVAYLDPEGGSDYDAHTVTAVPDKDGRFRLHCKHLVAGKKAELRIQICHVNGATNRRTFAYSVDESGTPDLSTLATTLALNPIITALQSREQAKLESALASLPDRLEDESDREHALAIAERLIKGLGGEKRLNPEEIEPARTELPLSDLRPAEAQVGYHRPTYDYLPTEGLLLTSAGRLFRHGLYAHAPARHRYPLDSQWSSLQGSCGLADGMDGSCQFIIKLDGKEVFQSAVLKAGKQANYQIDLTGGKELELIVTDGGDGPRADWGVWLEPTLQR
ncbi:NPCBM/NEW2 domain-containing protein [Roseibacillus ishigakijimensis]|uniref:NPCBM/NEW2 domain-containing protein n=1 Tax=Roseibacillus ishigakijimensis TaxID=454146 RepID=A0A934RSA2_9BACT|nr:NPCBM/NEW2 domain-containing protein [Roseibacillus ishigakijimensis]MBK1833310.1 NPCBM/NEW2 domain-containing protein [Roseibacillus ishigakijimensis]